jgi:two-component system cell cycle sensor histidine kinase/response regulator CckA
MGALTNTQEWASAASDVAISRISRNARWCFTAAVPVMVITVATLGAMQQPLTGAIALTLFHSMATLGLWIFRGRSRIEGLIALTDLLAVQVLTLIRFGPTSGVGMLTALLVVLSLIYFRRRVALLILVASIAATAVVGAVLTLLYPRDVPELDLGRTLVWMRTAGITLFLTVVVLFTVERILNAMRKALADAKSASEAEVEARRLQAQTAKELARTRELESLGRLAGGVAHDFNNALTVILSCASELAEDPNSALRLDLARDIEQAARGAAATTRQLLALAKIRRDTSESTNPTECLRSSLANLKRLLPTDLGFDADLQQCPDVPLAEGDLIQIVVNLVLNARDACRTGDRIVVRTRPAGDEVLLGVEDTGRGMDESTMKHVFEPFFTTKGQGGTGLGLAMVKATVSERAGRVEIQSREGIGTTVSIFLPAVASPVPETAPITERARLDGMKVLLVEDEADIQRTMQRSLEQAGACVRPAHTATAAIALMGEGGYDLLCTDGILLGGTALPIIQVFLERFPAAPILLCSGHVPAELEVRGLLAGRHTRLPKPFTPAELVAAVSRLRSKQRPTPNL